ncbi:MAG: DUF4239 domain-containing protein [Ignavibacteriae bacterium]|nr:MAG: DUF4239 domain-containing protein [Ignavibacteriota bacterium]
MRALLYLPSSLSFFIVVAVSVAIALFGLMLVRKRYSPEKLRENHEVAGFIFNAFGLIYAVLLAFVVFAAWTEYETSKENIEAEANKLSDLYLDSEGFPEPIRAETRTRILKYAYIVVKDEWQKMENGERSEDARIVLEDIFKYYLSIDVNNIPNIYAYQESLKRLNELSESRRIRLLDSKDNVPGIIWLVVIVGAVISIGYTYLFGSYRASAQYIMTAALTITNSMVLFLIYILDHPFTGNNKILPDALQRIIETYKNFPF